MSSPSAGRPAPGRIAPAMLLGCGLALLMTLPRALEVWAGGVFHNPDDAMRAVEVRDFLAGQGWYDLVPRRLSPGAPFPMHWSRLVDAPLAGIEALFRLGLPPEGAERAMRLLVPSLLFAAALRLAIAIACGLAGSAAALPAALLFASSSEIVGQFIPGHIHHHGIQAVLLLGSAALLLGALVRSPGPGRSAAAAAAGAGGVMALSLGVGLQNLPFAGAEAAVAALAWLAAGERARAVPAGFGAGLAGGAVLAFVADVAPAAWGSGACDAFSTAHLLGCALGGVGLAGLAAFGGRLRPSGRAVALAVLASGVAAALALAYPACLQDPMAGVDPLLRRDWLAGVGEALPLPRLVMLDPVGGAVLALTLLGGLLATALALRAAPPGGRAGWTALGLLALVGAAGTFYQVRVAPAACAFLVPGVAAAVLRVHERLGRRPHRPALLAAVLLGLFGNGAAWAALGVPAARLVAGPGTGGGRVAAEPWACFDPALYRPLAALPPGLVLSTIDPGSVILASTPHAVLAAPYHRDTAGIRVALLAFAATPAEAEAVVGASGATYLAACRASNELAETAARHPGSLAASLLDGHPPPWLVPVGTGREPVLLFRVATGASG